MTITQPTVSQPGQRPAAARIPPQNLDAETSLLGAMLLSRDAIASAVEIGLGAGDFYSPAHGHIYAAILQLDMHSQPVDAVTVADVLGRDGLLDDCGGLPALTGMAADTPYISGAGRYATIVAEMAQLRALIAAGGEVSEIGWSLPEDVPAAIDRAEQEVFKVGQRREASALITLDELLETGLASIEALYESGSSVTGLRSGFVDLDEMTAGFQPGDLIVVGARPSVGKSAFALDVARRAALVERKPVVMFNLEMSAGQIAQRIFSAEGRVDGTRVRSGRLLDADWVKLSRAVTNGADAPLLIDTNRDLTINQIRAALRRACNRYGPVGLVIIDYLQLMHSDTSRAENRQLEIAQISRGAKILAGEIGAPVLALSQINRAVETRADKRPTLADLRESGALEADADVVLLLYRDELYNPESKDRGVAEVIVAKQRNGPTGTIKLAYLDHYASFANMARV